MKPRPRPHDGIARLAALLLTLTALASLVAAEAIAPGGPTNAPIVWSKLGAAADRQYSGDGLAVTATAGGARLQCVCQQLAGEATTEGLWLTSTLADSQGERFRVTAVAVGRGDGPASAALLPLQGRVTVADQAVRFTRPGLMEEYTASMGGVRQDFVVLERPAGAGPLRVELAVAGARVEALAGTAGAPDAGPGDPACRAPVGRVRARGARLVLDGSGRKLAYSRLHVTDATGRELPAQMEVGPASVANGTEADVAAPRQNAANFQPRNSGAPPGRRYATALALVVDDTDAAYPVRIDPTFSDANWISMVGLADVGRMGDPQNPLVYALAASGSDVYVGGDFTTAGGIGAENLAKWSGSAWSPLGGGLGGNWEFSVRALAVSGSDVYAVVTYGGIWRQGANSISKWDGSAWSPLGALLSGLGGVPRVPALAALGSDLYAGGSFRTEGGIAATNIAKWDGTTWSPLGVGVNGEVSALAVSGTHLYAGGGFTAAGGSPANYIAKWNGSSWSALGSGVNGTVSKLVVSGSDVYAAGSFTEAGGSAATNIAKWDGSRWTALGLGINGGVYALAVWGNDLYAAGDFTAAGGIAANRIAKWNGSRWSALGSGMNSTVYALAVSGSDLYAGGSFTTAGGKVSMACAKADLPQVPGWNFDPVFGWLWDTGTGWYGGSAYGWMWFHPDGVWIWSSSLQGWLAFTDTNSQTLWSTQFRWLTPSATDPFHAHTTAIGAIRIGQHQESVISEGWVISDRFGYVWAAGDGVWFYTTGYGWLGVTPDGGIWSVNEGRFL
jgi:hypothetical protein